MLLDRITFLYGGGASVKAMVGDSEIIHRTWSRWVPGVGDLPADSLQSRWVDEYIPKRWIWCEVQVTEHWIKSSGQTGIRLLTSLWPSAWWAICEWLPLFSLNVCTDKRLSTSMLVSKSEQMVGCMTRTAKTQKFLGWVMPDPPEPWQGQNFVEFQEIHVWLREQGRTLKISPSFLRGRFLWGHIPTPPYSLGCWSDWEI